MSIDHSTDRTHRYRVRSDLLECTRCKIEHICEVYHTRYTTNDAEKTKKMGVLVSYPEIPTPPANNVLPHQADYRIDYANELSISGIRCHEFGHYRTCKWRLGSALLVRGERGAPLFGHLCLRPWQSPVTTSSCRVPHSAVYVVRDPTLARVLSSGKVSHD